MNIRPAILTSSPVTVAEQVALAADHAPDSIEVVQIDIIDGEFAPDMTVTPADLTDLDFGPLRLDFHLMTNEPTDYMWEIFDEAPLLPIRGLIAQIEHMSDFAFFCEQVTNHQFLAGISLDLYTPVEEIAAPWVESGQLKIIQLMSIEAGAQGRPFQKDLLLDKFNELLALFGPQILHHQIELSFDGGLNPENISAIIAATPAEFRPLLAFGVGSYLWKNDFSDALAQIEAVEHET